MRRRNNAINVLLTIAAAWGAERADAADPALPCRIEVVDGQNGWPVPLVELKTTHHVRFVTDNAGVIALDLPELMGRQTWFDVIGHGYQRPADGFGMRGVRLTPEPGKTLRVEVSRTSIAKRLGRLTGAGLFGESEQFDPGFDPGIAETGVMGCDSVQNAVHRGKLFWAWGDTALPSYALGVFHMTSATTPLRPLRSFEPPVHIEFDYFRNERGQPRGVAPMPGEGPTWLSGYASLPDKTGAERLVATYVKVRPPMEAYEYGLCVWDDESEIFKSVRTIWRKSDVAPTHPPVPRGHVTIFEESGGRRVALFGDPLPAMRCEATFEAWQDPASWKVLTPQASLISAAEGAEVKPHSGSIAYNKFRGRWVTVFMQSLGAPSAFGELWYAEADSPYGPWGPAVKVLSHENYTFYNPRLHADFTPPDSPMLLFEGTYTAAFADRPPATPRWDYNQVLYRLDLDDPLLAPAHSAAR